MPIAWIGNVGWPEVLVILLIGLLLFGAKRLPELARSIGKSLSEFHKGRAEGLKPPPADEPDKSADN